MALFDWLSPARKKAKPEPVSSGLSRMESTRPVAAPRRGAAQAEPAPGKPANRKHERMARRELLYAVVRQCMANAGVVSAAYKFKVLSLDPRGRQFLVMVDLSREFAGDTMRLAEIEAMVAQSAKVRYDIMVSAVYWRTNEHVAVGLAGGRPQPLGAVSRPAPLHAAAPAAARFDPLLVDEVEAFKKALATGVSASQAMATAAAAAPSNGKARSFDGATKQGPQSYTLLTGFEDTELPDTDVRAPALSATQYGDLR